MEGTACRSARIFSSAMREARQLANAIAEPMVTTSSAAPARNRRVAKLSPCRFWSGVASAAMRAAPVVVPAGVDPLGVSVAVDIPRHGRVVAAELVLVLEAPIARSVQDHVQGAPPAGLQLHREL